MTITPEEIENLRRLNDHIVQSLIDAYEVEKAAREKAESALADLNKRRDFDLDADAANRRAETEKARADRLAKALEPFDKMLTELCDGVGYTDDAYIGGGVTYGMLRRARAGLAEEPKT